MNTRHTTRPSVTEGLVYGDHHMITATLGKQANTLFLHNHLIVPYRPKKIIPAVTSILVA